MIQLFSLLKMAAGNIFMSVSLDQERAVDSFPPTMIADTDHELSNKL